MTRCALPLNQRSAFLQHLGRDLFHKLSRDASRYFLDIAIGVQLYDICTYQRFEAFYDRQHVAYGHGGGDMHRGGECVVRGLAHVAVIVGVHRILGADDAAESEAEPR